MLSIFLFRLTGIEKWGAWTDISEEEIDEMSSIRCSAGYIKFERRYLNRQDEKWLEDFSA